MFFFGHLGIGSKMVSPWTAGLKRSHVLVGTILPDLIDKPFFFTGLSDSSRAYGHTAIFLLLLSGGAIVRRSKLLAALALGVATHLFLDNLADHFLPPGKMPTALLAMTWPLSGRKFPVVPYESGALFHSFTPLIIGAEIVGVALLLWDQWKIVYEGEILEATQERRRFFKRVKKSRKSKATT